MERDARGRFLSGNKAAVGNRGNRKPKYGNRNAMKHGLYETLIYPRIREDGSIVLIKGNGEGITALKMNPSYCHVDDDGAFWLHVDVLKELEDIGWHLKTGESVYFG